MNNHKSGRDNNKKEVPQIGFEIDGSVVKCSLSTFNNILERECINFMLKRQEKEDIIALNNLVNLQDWKSKYNKLETQARMLDSIGTALKNDLKINEFAQPVRCLSASVNQHVIVTITDEGKKTRDTASYALNGSKKKCQVVTLSDSDDDIITTDTSNIKSIPTKNNNIIDLIDLDNDTENLEVKYELAPKSKTNCQSNSEDDPVILTDTSKIKPIPTKNNNIIDLIDLDNDTKNVEVKYELAPKSKTNCQSNSEDDPVILTDTSKIKPIPTKNNNIIDLIDLDNDTENLEVKYELAPKSKTNCQSNSEDDPVILTDTSKIKPIPTKNNNIIDLIDLDNDTKNLEVKYELAPKSKTNCQSNSEDDPVILTDTSKIKPIPTKNNNIIDLIDLDNDTKNLEVKYELAPKSKTNDNNKVLPIKTKAGNTLSNGGFLSTIIHKRKPGPKSKTMFVSDMVPFNAENEETPAKRMRFNRWEVINNKESNTINFLSCNSIKKLEDAEELIYNLKTSSLKYPPPYPLIPPHNSRPSWKNVPPRPNMSIVVSENKVILTWDLDLNWQTAKIKMYELFVCQESDAPPHISMWKKKGNIEADKLPMACELEVFDLGHIYYFALRAVDVHDRRALCAVQKTKI